VNTRGSRAFRIETARLVIRCWDPADAAVHVRAHERQLLPSRGISEDLDHRSQASGWSHWFWEAGRPFRDFRAIRDPLSGSLILRQ